MNENPTVQFIGLQFLFRTVGCLKAPLLSSSRLLFLVLSTFRFFSSTPIRVLLFVVFSLLISSLYAQTGEINLIPRNVYVGDLASLILTMPPSNRESNDLSDIILLPHSVDFPRDPNIDFHRIVLERRAASDRLLVEFTAFVPGFLEFPDINIGGESFTGLYVNINSIIAATGSVMELSMPASSLAMPGTAVLLYSVFAGLVFSVLIILFLALKRKKYLRAFIIKWNLWKHILLIKSTENRLQKKLLKGGDKRAILDTISSDFRVFLSFIANINCRTMTAREFKNILKKEGEFLAGFFIKCDELRFSGIAAETDDISKLLAAMKSFIGRLQISSLEKELRETAA